MLGGILLYLAPFGTICLIYDLFVEQTQETFFRQYALSHMLDVTMFALLIVGAVGVCLRQANRLGKVGKIGFRLTLTGSVISAIVGSTIIVVGYAVSDEATLEILDAITHPLARLPYAGGSLIFGMPTVRAGILPAKGRLWWRSVRSGLSPCS